jgi:hypothetical protein
MEDTLDAVATLAPSELDEPTAGEDRLVALAEEFREAIRRKIAPSD